MKNSDCRPLRIISEFSKNKENQTSRIGAVSLDAYVVALSNLAIAESNLIKAKKSSALPHFIAIIKELETLCGFKFEILPDKEEESN